MKNEKQMNINGAILTDEIIKELINLEEEDSADDYCECITNMNKFLVKCLDGAMPEMKDRELIHYLNYLAYFHDFFRLFRNLGVQEEAV
jgi:hypothetical protein